MTGPVPPAFVSDLVSYSLKDAAIHLHRASFWPPTQVSAVESCPPENSHFSAWLAECQTQRRMTRLNYLGRPSSSVQNEQLTEIFGAWSPGTVLQSAGWCYGDPKRRQVVVGQLMHYYGLRLLMWFPFRIPTHCRSSRMGSCNWLRARTSAQCRMSRIRIPAGPGQSIDRQCLPLMSVADRCRTVAAVVVGYARQSTSDYGPFTGKEDDGKGRRLGDDFTTAPVF